MFNKDKHLIFGAQLDLLMIEQQKPKFSLKGGVA